jgi:hypothetical protein
MAAPDPNGDLIRAMLERRAGQPAPDAILDRVMRAAATRPQERGGRGRARRQAGPSGSTVLVGILVAAIVGLLAVIVILVASPWPGGPGGPVESAGIAAATPPDDPGPGTSGVTPDDPTMPTAATPVASTPAVALTLAPDRMAVVTRAGDGLRVRSVPSTADDRTRLWPLLPGGTRMYIVGGPVHADTYTWYQVQVLGKPAPLFGWVATGKDGEEWIKPDRPRCPDTLDVQAFAAMAPLDFLACYGSAEVTLEATLRGIRDDGADGCPLGDPDRACRVEPDWMLQPRVIAYRTANGFEGEIEAAVPPDLEDRVSALPEGTPMTLTVAMDHPDAGECRVFDPDTRKDAAPQDQAITRCRATFVVGDVTPAP